MKKRILMYQAFLLLIISSFIYSQNKILTVEDIYTNPSFIPVTLDGVQWYDDGEKFSYMKYDTINFAYDIYEHNPETGNEKKIVSGEKIISGDERFDFSNYSWSPDHKYILFSEVLRARSLKAGGMFLIYNVEKEKIIKIIQSEEEQLNVKFSPDSKKVGFVRGNNIYVLDLENGKEKQLTQDGSEVILNGRFDWVYEEEFSIIDGWEWAPDSKKIAFWRLDQSNVPEIKIQLYDSLYFNYKSIHYPKPGSKNSIVKIGAADVNDGKIIWMNTGTEEDIYIPRIKFTNDTNILSVQKLNRLQNHLELILFDINKGKGSTIISEQSDTWVDVDDDLAFLKDGKHLIWSSDRDGFNHLYLYNINGTLVNQITKGMFDVDQLHAVTDNKVFYSSSERGRIYLDLYSVNIDGTNQALVTSQIGNHKVTVSPSGKYIIDQYSASGLLPKTFLVESSSKVIRELTDTKINPLINYSLSPVEFFNFTASDSVELDAFIIKPADFDSTKKYPVIIDQYSGPGSKVVKDFWGGRNHLWRELMAQKGLIIVGVDPRSMGRNGSAYKKLIYKNLGKWETNDLIETAKYLGGLPYVDSKRIGIWGWSYGGYTASLAILIGTEYFNTAVAVAPVTHWKFYDDIYTERFMSLPHLNPDGYEKSSPLKYANLLKGNLLIIHGMADDNVHFQNSVNLVNALIAAQKQFQVMYYPGKEHSLLGTKTRINLFNLITDYLIENLKN